jgi:hypothetical protein
MYRISTLAVFLVAALAFAAPAPSSPLLPGSFAGWTETGSISTAPDAADAAALHEYGLTQLAATTYVLGTQRMAVHAWRFTDATGAYGAFTFFRQPQMHTEVIGRGAAADDDHFLFWNGVTVVEVSFAQPFGGEKSAVAALAARIPKVIGSEGIPPSLPRYLPVAQLDPASVRYAIGPAAYAQMGGTLPASAIDFSQDAEAITAHYGPPGSQETLTLIMYPTPQIAGAHLRNIDALAKSSGITTKRSGPLVAVALGAASPQQVRQLLSEIRFSDYVTINHPEGYISEGAKMYRLLLGITVLIVILAGAALLLGIFLGGGRALVRILRGKPASSVSDEEFISLHLGG